jgi:hypothetical protein
MPAPDNQPPRPRPSFLRRLWGFFMFLLLVATAGVAVYAHYLLQREQAARAELAKTLAQVEPRFEAFKAAVRDVDRHLSSVVFQEVDLSRAGWQAIEGGFYVIDLGVSPEAKGVRIAGKIINPTSVTHEAAKFSLRIGEHHAAFTLARVPPAIAQPFEVTMADVAPADAQRAFVALESSTITFASSTTRKGAAAAPLDTDKLLK